MKDPLESLRRAEETLRQAAEAKQRAKNEADRMAILEGVTMSLPQMLEPLLTQVSENAKVSSAEMVAALKGVTIDQAKVDVHVETPKAEVTVKHDPITIPEVNTEGIEVALARGLAAFKIPKPEVTVNVPKFPDFPKIPEPKEFNGQVTLKGVDRKNPVPVLMVGLDGKPMPMGGSVISGGGGRGDFFTISDIRGSTASLIDQTEGALRVVGSFTASVGSTYATLANADGAITSANPLQIAGSLSTTPGGTFYASDAVGSTNIIQLGGNDIALNAGVTNAGTQRVVHAADVGVSVTATQTGTWNITTVTGITNTVGVVTINPDGNPTYTTGGSSSGGAVQVQDSLGSTITSFGSGDSKGLAVAIVDASGAQITSFGGGTQYAEGAATSTYTGTALIWKDSEEKARVVTSSNPLPVTGSFSATLSAATGQGDGSAALRVIQAGDTVSSVIVNSGTITTVTTVTGVTNSVAVVALDRDGNPLTTGPIGLGDAATALRVVVAGNSDASVTATQTGTWNIGTVTTVTGITNSLAANIVDSTGVAYTTSNPLPVGDAGGSLTIDGTVTVSSITASTAATLVDSSGVAYSGSNPLPTTASATLSAATGPGEQASALRITQAGDAVSSINLLQINGTAPTVLAVGIADSNANTLRVVTATDSINSTQLHLIARTTNPTAIADGVTSFATSDKLGRALNRPVQVRELMATAYVSLTNGTETTLATASAGTYLDLIYVMATNTSTAAQQIDIRAVSGGNIVHSMQIGANATVGFTLPVPWPQDATGNAWTADNADVTNSTVYVSALFSKET